MDINGLWLTTHYNYKKNHLFFESWKWHNIKIQPIYELKEAILAIKQTNLDFVFIEDEFFDLVDVEFYLKTIVLKTPWIFKLCSSKEVVQEKNKDVYFYKSLVRPFAQIDFEDLLLQIIVYKKACQIRSRITPQKTLIIPDTEGALVVPVIKVENLCYIRKKENETLIQFDDGVIRNHKTSFKTFFKLTQCYSNIFEVTPHLLVNLDKLEKITHDDQHNEFICSLVTEKNIELSKLQRNRLMTYIENHS